MSDAGRAPPKRKNRKKWKKRRGGFIDRIGYKRLHERERRRRDNTKKKGLRIYMRTHTHTHASHIRTRAHFFHATEPNTGEPSNTNAFQSDAPSQSANLPNAGIKQPSPILPNADTCAVTLHVRLGRPGNVGLAVKSNKSGWRV